MALLALVVPGRGRKLSLVFVVMTIQTAGEFHLKERVLALGDVAPRALYLRVFAGQWIRAGCMRLNIEL